MSGNMIATGTVVNNTSYDLYVVATSTNLISGHWNTAPVTVPANSTLPSAFIAQGTSGTATGTSGQVTYSLNGASPSVAVVCTFDDPFDGSNVATIKGWPASSAFTLTASVPKSGSNVVFTYTITPA